MAATSPRDFLRDVLLRVAQRAERRVRPLIPSETLKHALHIRLEEAVDGMVAKLSIPHYWAVYLHDGRARFSKSDGFLVFFKNIADDPRVEGGFPERASDIRRLTREQFRAGLALNRNHFASGGIAFDAPMIVVRQVGPAKGAEFFTRGMAGFLDQTAAPMLREEFDAYMQSLIDNGLHERATARFHL